VIAQAVQTQTNVLFISVDTDAKPNPRLVSVWGLFFTSLNQNAAEFMPLYPSKDPLKDTILMSEFSFDQDVHLVPSFLDLTQKAFQVKWDAYIVINQKEIDKILKLMGKDTNNSDSDSLSVRPEIILLRQLCALLKSDSVNLDFHHLVDTQILDHNISTSLLVALDQWAKIGQPFNSCEVQQ
jgi:hypothetical protein